MKLPSWNEFWKGPLKSLETPSDLLGEMLQGAWNGDLVETLVMRV